LLLQALSDWTRRTRILRRTAALESLPYLVAIRSVHARPGELHDARVKNQAVRFGEGVQASGLRKSTSADSQGQYREQKHLIRGFILGGIRYIGASNTTLTLAASKEKSYNGLRCAFVKLSPSLTTSLRNIYLLILLEACFRVYSHVTPWEFCVGASRPGWLWRDESES
jgi:hypothetical protein